MNTAGTGYCAIPEEAGYASTSTAPCTPLPAIDRDLMVHLRRSDLPKWFDVNIFELVDVTNATSPASARPGSGIVALMGPWVLG